MAPKQKAVSELGAVAEHGNGWRARAQLGRGLEVTGPTHFGPVARRKAEADLVHARRASTRDEMQRVLRNLKDGSEPKAASFAEPLPQPGQTHPCGGPRPESDGDANAPPAKRVRTPSEQLETISNCPHCLAKDD